MPAPVVCNLHTIDVCGDGAACDSPQNVIPGIGRHRCRRLESIWIVCSIIKTETYCPTLQNQIIVVFEIATARDYNPAVPSKIGYREFYPCGYRECGEVILRSGFTYALAPSKRRAWPSLPRAGEPDWLML